MAIIAVQPTVIDDVTYDKYAVSIAISPVYKDDSIGASVAMRLTPYTDDNGVVIKADRADKAVVFSDVFEQNDEALLLASSKIMDAISEFLTAKGI